MSPAKRSFLLQPDNWFQLLDARTDLGAPVLEQPNGRQASDLFKLSTVELHFLRDQVLDLAASGEEHSPALAALLENLRLHLVSRGAHPQSGKARLLLGLPDLDSPVLADAARLASLSAGLPWIANHVCLRAWAKQLARNKELILRSRECAQLRSLLEIAASQGARSLLPSLRKIHAQGFSQAMSDEQAELASKYGYEDLLARAHLWLGLKRRRRQRRRPFLLKKAGSKRKPDEADLSVLLLADGKRKLGQQSRESIAAQSLPPREVLDVSAAKDLKQSILKACSATRSTWISLLRAGDKYHPKRLSECMALAKQTKNAKLICSAVHFVDAKGLQVSSSSCNRLEHGDLVYDWMQVHERHRPRSSSPGKLLHALHAADFVLSPSNLLCRRKFLMTELDALLASGPTLAWQLAFIAAQKAGLIYCTKKLLAMPIPRARELFTPGSGQDVGLRTSFDEHLQGRLLRHARSVLPNKELASSLAERDRLKAELELTRRNRDRLETLLTARSQESTAKASPPTQLRISERIQAKQEALPRLSGSRSFTSNSSLVDKTTGAMVCTLPPDHAARELLHELAKQFGVRPEVLYWQDESNRIHRGRMLRTDRDAFVEDLGFLRRNWPLQLREALDLFADAMGQSPREIEFDPDLQRGFTFARKVALLRPAYLHGWGLGRSGTACLLSQLLFGIGRGLVLHQLPLPGSHEARFFAVHLASAEFLMVAENDLRLRLIDLGVDSERIYLTPAELPSIKQQLDHLLNREPRHEGLER